MKITAMILYVVSLFAEPGVQAVDVAGDAATVSYDPKPFHYMLKRQDGQWKLDVTATYNAMPAALREMLDEMIPDEGEARQQQCLSSLKQIMLGMLMYAQDHDNVLPDAATWMDELMPYLKNDQLFYCPSAPHLKHGYAMNAALSKRSTAEIAEPWTVAVIFDSDLGTRNASGGPDAVANPPRHNGGNNYAYVDGHVKWCTEIPSFGDLPQPETATPGPVGTSTDASFAADVLQAEGPVVVLFWSPAEATSIRMSGTLRALAGQYSDVAKFTAVLAEAAPQTAAAHAVTTYPTLLLFRDGELVDRLVGSWDQDAVKVWLEVKLKG
jgi:prepilin-type processing-associated H-X9-DG protein